MMLQIRPSVTNPTIADIYHQIDENKLVLQPDFQRKFVWNNRHQEEFLDTIINGLPFPEIYVCNGEVDVQNLITTRLVIDGQQRLTTIRNYIKGSHDFNFSRIKTFNELSQQEKQRFLSYQVVMRDLGEVDQQTIREIFRRINLTKFKLDDIEIHNAIYDGPFIQTAKDILENIDLEVYGVLKESEFTRMADLHFILLVMSTIETGGYFSQDKELESQVAIHNEEYGNAEIIKELLIKTFEKIKSLSLPSSSMWFRKSNFFTLVVELSKNINCLPKDFKERLLEFESNIDLVKSGSKLADSDLNDRFSTYYSYMYQGTNNRTARVTRGMLFHESCIV